MLVDPDFLLRVQQDPPTASGAPRPAARRLTDIELASRLSFFLWSSIPDEPPAGSGRARRAVDAGDAGPAGAAHAGRSARDVRPRGRLRRAVAEPAAGRRGGRASRRLSGLRRQPAGRVHRRRPSSSSPSTLRDDRSVSDLLRADYTFVNERLARHYGIPGIYGTRFRRVTLPNPDQRGGLLAHGALLATTSYPDRTSPVLRGKWLLDNIFGVYVPPPPAERRHDASRDQARHGAADHSRAAGATSDQSGLRQLPRGDRSARLRARTLRRDRRGGGPSTSRASRWMPPARPSSGAPVEGLAGLRAILLQQPDRFPTTVTEKLLAYALGRRLEYYDRPAVRQIVRAAAAARLSMVVADSGNREQSDVPDAGIPMTFLTAKSLASAHRAAGPRRDDRPAAAGGDDAGARPAPPRNRCTGSRPSTSRTGWRWSTGCRRPRARPSS